MMKNNSDEKLRILLKEWTPEVDIPPRFRSEVWSIIASKQAARENNFIFRIASLLSEWSFRPAFAYAVCTLSIMLGLFLGIRQTTPATHELKSHYIQSVDPYSKLNSEEAS